ncbi:hypothetical protein ACW4YW_01150 [Methylobacillus pratensis]
MKSGLRAVACESAHSAEIRLSDVLSYQQSSSFVLINQHLYECGFYNLLENIDLDRGMELAE